MMDKKTLRRWIWAGLAGLICLSFLAELLAML
jgi:hypothetical protein